MSLWLIFLKEWILVLALIFGGCCSNVYSLEVLTKEEPTSGNLITFCQFALIATEGLFFQLTTKGLKQRKIPLQNWGLMVCLFFTVSVLNNYALRFNIPMPLHIVFRSGSVMVSMLLGFIFFDRKFSKFQIIGVFLVTLGVIISTIASNNHASKNESPLKFMFGLGVLSLALVISCLLGQYQQIVYTKYGRHWREGLFYTHALCLPWFGLFYDDIINQIRQYNQSPLISVGEYLLFGVKYFEKSSFFLHLNQFFETKFGHLFHEYQSQFLELESINIIFSVFYSYLAQIYTILNSFLIPRLWLFMIINILTQFVCINGVSKLTSMTTSVTVNLVLSIRKFVSLFLSIYIFSNQFTTANAVGVVLVFIGTVMYAVSKSPDRIASSANARKTND